MADFLMPFSGNPLDRASNQREDEAWLTEQASAIEARYLLVSKLDVLTRGSDVPELVWVDSLARSALAIEAVPVLLGLRDGVAHFALDISAIEDPLPLLGLEGARFAEPRGLATTLPAGDAGIVAQARALVDWHARH